MMTSVDPAAHGGHGQQARLQPPRAHPGPLAARRAASPPTPSPATSTSRRSTASTTASTASTTPRTARARTWPTARSLPRRAWASGRSSCSSTSTIRTGTTTRRPTCCGSSSPSPTRARSPATGGSSSPGPGRPRRHADLAHLLALYDGEIRYADGQVGRVLDRLAERGLDETHPGRPDLRPRRGVPGARLLGAPADALRGAASASPSSLRGPGIAAGRRERAQVSLLDVAPTILDWAGLPPLPTQRGRSLLRPLEYREAYGETDHALPDTRKLFLRDGAGRSKVILTFDRKSEALVPGGVVRPGRRPERNPLISPARGRRRAHPGVAPGALASRPPPGPGRPARRPLPGADRAAPRPRLHPVAAPKPAVLFSSSSYAAPVAQLDRASASGAEGYKFEPCRAHQSSQRNTPRLTPAPSGNRWGKVGQVHRPAPAPARPSPAGTPPMAMSFAPPSGINGRQAADRGAGTGTGGRWTSSRR